MIRVPTSAYISFFFSNDNDSLPGGVNKSELNWIPVTGILRGGIYSIEKVHQELYRELVMNVENLLFRA